MTIAGAPGIQIIVALYPDELHDGRAGDGKSFRYRTAYIAPSFLQEILGGRSLPFVAGGISSDHRLKRAVVALLDDLERTPEESEQHDLIYDLATALEAICGRGKAIASVNRLAAMRARDFIDARIETGFTLAELEREIQHQRWLLSRDFRTIFGTSPYRYLIARRLENACGMLSKGYTSAAAAHASGFVDQRHFRRAFRKAFGQTPDAWARTSANADNRSISTHVGLA